MDLIGITFILGLVFNFYICVVLCFWCVVIYGGCIVCGNFQIINEALAISRKKNLIIQVSQNVYNLDVTAQSLSQLFQDR